MEKLRVFLLSASLLLVAFSSASAQNQRKYFAVGANLTLDLSPPASATITRIFWKHNGNQVGDWTLNEFTFYGRFDGRTKMDTTTGRLEIENASKDDSGLFEVEVNNKIQDLRYDVRVIREVSEPSIRVSPDPCSPSSVRCTLVCEGRTDEAEPVSYWWREASGDWKEGTKDRVIGNETERVEKFYCQIKNPVSERISESKNNPFFKETHVPENSGNVGGVVVGVVLFILLLIAVVIGCWQRDRIKTLFHQYTDNNSGPSGGGNKESSSDGAAASSSAERVPLNKQDPPADPNKEEPRPPAGPNNEEPRPPADPNNEEPRPPADPNNGEPRPLTDPNNGEPRPPADPNNEEPRPPADPNNEKPRPPADPNKEEPRPPADPHSRSQSSQ